MDEVEDEESSPPLNSRNVHHSHHHHYQNSREKRGSSTPKRTHSFSSFSQLSTNSLPDIKELHPTTTVLTINGNRHHYHHHHHPNRDVTRDITRDGRDVTDSRVIRPNGKQVLKIHHSSPVKPSLRPLVKATSKDDDLMASLEMMNNLAADLPHSNGNHGGNNGGNGSTSLKRSFTVQHRRPTAKTPTEQDTKKPPLPKLSLGSHNSNTSPAVTPTMVTSHHSSHFSDTSSTGSSGSSNMPNTYKQVLASRMHSSSSSSPLSSGSSPNIPLHVYPASPRPNRPKELFVRQITLPMESKAYEETPIVPSPSLASPLKTPTGGGSSNKQVPPPIPARRYPRGVYHAISSSNNNTDESESDQRRGSESGGGHYQRSTVSADSGILTSPSPPTDSGIAVSPPVQLRSTNKPSGGSTNMVPNPPDQFADYETKKSTSDDTVSITSSSESDTTSGSRYDNVVPKKSQNRHSFGSERRCSNETMSSSSKTSTLVAAAAEIAAQRVNNNNNNASRDVTSRGVTSSPTREMSTQTILDGEDGDDEDEASDTSSDILVLDSSSSDVTRDNTRDRRYVTDVTDEEEEDDPEVPDDGSKNHDEIEISDHFCRRNNSRRNYVISNRHSGPYDNFVLPGAVLPPPSSVSSSVETPLSSASSPSPPALSPNAGRNPMTDNSEKLEPASIKRLLAAGPTSNV